MLIKGQLRCQSMVADPCATHHQPPLLQSCFWDHAPAQNTQGDISAGSRDQGGQPSLLGHLKQHPNSCVEDLDMAEQE